MKFQRVYTKLVQLTQRSGEPLLLYDFRPIFQVLLMIVS